MPGLSGLELAQVLRRFREPPKVVFVTAYDAHAVDAFEVGAVDYLLKPVRESRLAEAIRRAVAAGARPDTVAIVDVEDVPLAYLPSNATRIRVKAVGDLALDGGEA